MWISRKQLDEILDAVKKAQKQRDDAQDRAIQELERQIRKADSRMDTICKAFSLKKGGDLNVDGSSVVDCNISHPDACNNERTKQG